MKNYKNPRNPNNCTEKKECCKNKDNDISQYCRNNVEINNSLFDIMIEEKSEKKECCKKRGLHNG